MKPLSVGIVLAASIACGAAYGQETQSYSYDVYGRLIGVVRAARTRTYVLDNAGSRQQRTTTSPPSPTRSASSSLNDVDVRARSPEADPPVARVSNR
ncbi:hypothetical protein D3C85_1357940 [compost metagenome]